MTQSRRSNLSIHERGRRRMSLPFHLLLIAVLTMKKREGVHPEGKGTAQVGTCSRKCQDRRRCN